MQEQTSTKKQQSEPRINGTTSSDPARADRTAAGGGAGNLATAIEKLIRYLEEREPANPSQKDAHRMLVDIDSLKDLLERYESGKAPAGKAPAGEAPGQNQRSKPIAQHEGQANGATQSRQWKAEEEGRASDSSAARPAQPAKVFTSGNVTTKVWANHDGFGQLTWRIQQLRDYRTKTGQWEARSLQFDDLRDARWGALQAERFIRKNERRYRLLGWFLGY